MNCKLNQYNYKGTHVLTDNTASPHFIAMAIKTWRPACPISCPQKNIALSGYIDNKPKACHMHVKYIRKFAQTYLKWNWKIMIRSLIVRHLSGKWIWLRDINKTWKVNGMLHIHIFVYQSPGSSGSQISLPLSSLLYIWNMISSPFNNSDGDSTGNENMKMIENYVIYIFFS